MKCTVEGCDRPAMRYQALCEEHLERLRNPIQHLREELGISIQEAKQILRGEDLIELAQSAETVEDLRAVVVEIIRDKYRQRPT